MSDEFEILYNSVAPCSGEELGWEWDEDSMQFVAECSNGNIYHLIPSMATIVADPDNEDEDV